jgi:hypothetical protein
MDQHTVDSASGMPQEHTMHVVRWQEPSHDGSNPRPYVQATSAVGVDEAHARKDLQHASRTHYQWLEGIQGEMESQS